MRSALDRVSNLLVGPTTKTRLFVRREICAVHRAKWNGKGSSASVRRPLWITVASAASGYGKNILAFGDHLFVVGLRMCHAG
jgi:hypothetical protein